MAPQTEEDIEWFKSTFHPVPKARIPEDCVLYSLYWIKPGTKSNDVDDQDRNDLSPLSSVQKAAAELVEEHLKGYIWQRDPFKLELAREDGINLLRGRTEYGDSIEDEWLIVYILRELSRKFQELWIKVTDSDGEFLLVEAAGSLPAWLEPEVADNRVWINNGELVIITPKGGGGVGRRGQKTAERLTTQDARRIILAAPKKLLRSPSIEAEAFYRLRNYPRQIQDNLHTARITIPRKIAYLQHLKPSYISLAVEAFYLRDPISMRPLRSKDSAALIFPPSDCVTVSVRFTRVSYAQLKSQDIVAPATWKDKLPFDPQSEAFGRAETGMKLSCGFEMMLSDPQNKDKAVVKEIRSVLEDLHSGDRKLPTDEEIESSWEKREDHEKWLDISFEDLEGELRGAKGDGVRSVPAGRFGDQNAQENLQRIVAQFEKFFSNETAGFDGADIIDEFGSEDELDDVEELSSEEDEVAEIGQGDGSTWRSGFVEELDSGDDSEEGDDEKIEELSRQMEQELRATGALNLGESSERLSRRSGKGKVRESEDRISPGDHNLQEEDGEEEQVDIEYGEADININLVRNLLQSFQTQGGGSGPASTLTGMMGVKFPKDDRA